MPYMTIVIPAYNEAQRIDKTLFGLYDFFKDKDYDYEVIVVDDGSVDDTIRKAQASTIAKENKLKIISNSTNRGKGFSVKNGVLHSNGKYVLISDADLSTPIEEVDKLLSYIEQGSDIIIGSRNTSGSRVIAHQPWYREIMGKTFNLFVKILLFNEFNDTQCGFKLFKGDLAREIAREIYINGFAFDVEMLYLAKIKGYKVKEVGVTWDNSPESKVKLFRSPINMFLDLFKIKAAHPHLK